MASYYVRETKSPRAKFKWQVVRKSGRGGRIVGRHRTRQSAEYDAEKMNARSRGR